MPDADTTLDTPTDAEAAPAVNPFDSLPVDDVAPEAGAPEATPATEEAAPSSSTTDQPTTTPPPPKAPENPLAKALEQAPAPAVKPPPTALAPELAAIAADPKRLQQLANLEQLHGRQSNELGQARKALQQQEAQIQQFRQEQERAAQRAQLNPWNRDHPRHRDFAALRELRRRDDARLARTAPDQREAVKAALDADYTQEERDMLAGYDNWRRSEDALSPEDRDDRARQMARAEAREEFARLMNEHQVTSEARGFLDKNRDVVTKHRDVFEHALAQDDQGNFQTSRRDLANEIAMLKEQLAAATGQQVANAKVVESAKAREQITKTAAVVGRDGAGRKPRVNITKLAADAASHGEDPFTAILNHHTQPDT